MKYNPNKGFTLLEISIVLVVIGFILGVVLFGQDIIRAARVRSVITQLERYNAAVNVFKDRYANNIPGDIPFSTTAPWSSFFSTPGVVNNTAATTGDGNGFIHTTTGTPTAAIGVPSITGTGLEVANFFNQIGALGLVDFYGNASGATITLGGNFPFIKGFANNFSGGLVPLAGFRTNIYTTSDPGDVKNYWFVGIQNNASPILISAPPFRADDAYSIDNKIDDGMPNTGSVMAFGQVFNNLEFNPSRQTAPATTVSCIEGPGTSPTATDVYSIRSFGVNCSLRIRAAF